MFNSQAPNSRKPSEGSVVELLKHWEIEDGIVESNNRILEYAVEITLPATMFLSDEGHGSLAEMFAAIIRACTPELERSRIIHEVLPTQPRFNQQYRDADRAPTEQIRLMGETRAETIDAYMKTGVAREPRVYITTSFSKYKRAGRQAMDTKLWEIALEEARNARDGLLKTLSMYGIAAKPLDSQEAFELIWRFMNPSLVGATPPRYRSVNERYYKSMKPSSVRQMKNVYPETTRSQLCSSEIDNSLGTYLRVGDSYISCASMMALPDRSIFTMANRLIPKGGSCYIIVDIKRDVQSKAARSLLAKARIAIGMTRGAVAGAAGDRAVAAVHKLQGEERQIINVGVTAVLLHSDMTQLKEFERELYGHFNSFIGAKLAINHMDTLEHFRRAIPLNGQALKYLLKTFDDTAVDLIPTVATWKGTKRPVSVLINRFGGLTPYDTRDEGSMNGHMIVLGGSRSGKSYGLQALELDNVRLGHGLIVIDRGNSYDELVKAAGGSVINLDPALESINPFELEEGEELPDTRHRQFLDNLISEMLSSGDGLDDIDRAIVNEAVIQVYELNASSRQGVRVVQPTYLHNVTKHLVNMNRIGANAMIESDRIRANDIAKRLERWTGDTPLGQFLDRPSTVRLSDNVISFETGAMRENPELQVVGMMIVTNLILKRMRRDNSPKTIIFEEFKALMDTPAAIEIAVMLFSTAGKHNARVVAVNQGASIFRTAAADGIIQNVSNYLFFRMTGADTEILQNTFGLSDGAMRSLSQLTGIPGVYAEVLVARRRGDGVLEGDVLTVRVSPLEHWTYTSKPDERDARNAAIARHNGDNCRALLELAYGAQVFNPTHALEAGQGVHP